MGPSLVKPAVLRLCVLASVGLLVATAPAVAHEPPPTMTGEDLVGGELVEGGKSSITGTCNPDGVSQFQFLVTGSAFGPYEGSFVEAGSFTLGPRQPAPDNPTGDPNGN